MYQLILMHLHKLYFCCCCCFFVFFVIDTFIKCFVVLHLFLEQKVWKLFKIQWVLVVFISRKVIYMLYEAKYWAVSKDPTVLSSCLLCFIHLWVVYLLNVSCIHVQSNFFFILLYHVSKDPATSKSPCAVLLMSRITRITFAGKEKRRIRREIQRCSPLWMVWFLAWLML